MAVKPGQRIEYTLDALDYADENWPFVKALAIWAFRYPASTRSYPRQLHPGDARLCCPKPIYESIKEYTGN